MSLKGAAIMMSLIPLVNDCDQRLPRTFPKTTPDLRRPPRNMPPISTRKRTRVVVARRSGRESARVYESLRRQILDGDLAAGTHLSQQAIALTEGNSNGPVISALRRLAFDGLVVHERSHGYRVCD